MFLFTYSHFPYSFPLDLYICVHNIFFPYFETFFVEFLAAHSECHIAISVIC